MTTVRDEHPALERRPSFRELLVPEVAASLAIAVMWVAVVFTAAFGPDIVSTSDSGASTTIPSAVAVALFASLASAAVARRAFDREWRR